MKELLESKEFKISNLKLNIWDTDLVTWTNKITEINPESQKAQKRAPEKPCSLPRIDYLQRKDIKDD